MATLGSQAGRLLKMHRFRRSATLLQNVSRFSNEASNKGNFVAISEIKSFIERCMESVGTKSLHATQLAEVLIAADHRGHFSHGLNRLSMYVKDIQSGITVSDEEPAILRQSAATAHVDGRNVLGPVVGNFSMKLAIQKAKEAGIGWVAAKGSNHFGIAGWYSMQASDEGLLGMSFTNTSPLVVPTRARKPVIGTNPITLAAPGKKGDSFVLDMATSAVSLGKIELNNVKNIDIPTGWGANSKGVVTNNPSEVIGGGGLLPVGGSELTSGYKGYGLGVMVEIFCGIMADACYGSNIRQWKKTETVANLGQAFVAIDPEAFAPGFSDRMQDFMDTLRTLSPAEGEAEVLVAGDPERMHIDMCTKQGGIPYHPNQIRDMDELAASLGIEPMKRLDG